MSASASAQTAPPSGVAQAHRGLAMLFLAAGVVQFFLAGIGAFDNEWEAHAALGSFMTLLGLILLVLAVVGRRAALQASAVLFGLLVLQTVLARVGEDVAVVGALHPVNALLILFTASVAAAGRPVAPPRRPA